MQEDNGTFHTPNVGAKIGPILERARMERGLTLDEAEQATKIRKRYLSGLEREDYGVLPDAVYARGFLKTYANYLGLDGDKLARELRDRRRPRRERSGATYEAPAASEFDRPLVNPGGLRNKERRRVSGTTIRTLLVAVLALAAVVGSLYYVGRGAQSNGENPEQAPPAIRAAAGRQRPAATRGPARRRRRSPGRSPGQRSGRRSRRPARPAATARDAHSAGARRRRPVLAEHPCRRRALLRADRRARFLPDLPGAARDQHKDRQRRRRRGRRKRPGPREARRERRGPDPRLYSEDRDLRSPTKVPDIRSPRKVRSWERISPAV